VKTYDRIWMLKKGDGVTVGRHHQQLDMKSKRHNPKNNQELSNRYAGPQATDGVWSMRLPLQNQQRIAMAALHSPGNKKRNSGCRIIDATHSVGVIDHEHDRKIMSN
jgi:hypothetical protein